jgi:RHS repeat-associated protein
MSQDGRVQVGHPVDVASGAVFTAMVDIVFKGTISLGWRRVYATDLDVNSWLGRGWTVPWFASLQRTPEGYLLTDESGRLLLFPVDPAVDLPVGGSVVSYGANMELVRHHDRFVVHHWHHGTDDVEQFCFLVSGSPLMALAWLENLSGHRVVVRYDGLGRPIGLVQELEERRLEITYGDGDLISSIQQVRDDGSRRRVVRYEYDTRRRLVAAFDALDQRTSYEYDGSDRLVRETSVLGSSFTFRYDDHDRCIHTFGDGGYLERRLTYSSAPPSTRVTDSQGNVTLYVVNVAGQVIQEVGPLGAVSTTEYDEFGRPVSVRDATGGVLRYEYDAGGNRSAVIHQDGARTETRFNEFHLLDEYVTPSGATWKYSYNERGETIGLTTPLGHRYEAVRDGRGLVIETTLPSGRRLVFRHGPALRWVEAADQVSLLSRTEFDESGNQIAMFDAHGLVQRAVFDSLNRAIRLEDGVGRGYQIGWNGLSQRTELSGPGIPWEQRVYDRLGRIVEHLNPIGRMRVEYDSEGRITRVINRAGEQLRWDYGPDGRIVSEIGFDNRRELFEYGPRTVINTKPDGRTITITHDPLGKMIRRAPSDQGPAEFTYNVDGHLISATNDAATVRLERDLEGRVTAEVQNGRRIEYLHDPDGDRIGRRIPGIPQGQLGFVRDLRKRLVGLTDERGLCMELSWDNVDRVVERRFAGAVVQRDTFDERGRLSMQRVERFGSIVGERKYEYDADDYIVARDEWRQASSSFRHDEIGRLTDVVRDGQTVERYAYDANGAIVSTHRGPRLVAPGGAVIADGGRRYEYAEDGSVRSIADGQGTVFLEHDVEGQITKAMLPDGGMATYGYDALGRRAFKDVKGTRTEFLWEGPVLASEFVQGSPTLTHYFFAFEPLAQWSGSDRLMPATDISGMVREVFSERGDRVWQGRFDAYGNALAQSGGIAENIRFRGQYWDGETGFHYNFHRSYDPRVGDYLARDPIGIEGGSNFYLYPRNPLLWDDPFGLSCGKDDAHRAERSMDAYFASKGYKKIGSLGKDLNSNGIDGIYYKKGGNPPYIIAEAKSNSAGLGKDTFGNQQMSDNWINTKPGGGTDSSRLKQAFPEGSPIPARIESAGEKGNVAKAVYNPDRSSKNADDPARPPVLQDPKIQKTGTYDGGDSTTTTF